MWLWLKRHLEMLNFGVSTIAGIASVLIAFFAYQIDSMVQENSEREARISRSVALSQSIFADEAFKRLLPKANSIELQYNKAYDRAREEAEEAGKEFDGPSVLKEAQVSASLDVLKREETFRSDLILLLQHVKRAVKCIQSSSDKGLVSDNEELCDPETFLVLSGDALGDIYFQLRAALACDDSVNSPEQLEDFYDLVEMQSEQEQEMEGEDYEIYRTVEEAKGNGSRKQGMVIEFDKSFCEGYEAEMS